jgi:hypothetical protein
MIMSNFIFDKLTVAKSECVKLFLWFLFFIKKNSLNFAIFLHLQTYFWGGYAAQLWLHVLWEGGWDTGVGRSSYVYPSSTILNGNPWLARKHWQKLSLVNSLQLKNAQNYFWSHTFSEVKNSTNLTSTSTNRSIYICVAVTEVARLGPVRYLWVGTVIVVKKTMLMDTNFKVV